MLFFNERSCYTNTSKSECRQYYEKLRQVVGGISYAKRPKIYAWAFQNKARQKMFSAISELFLGECSIFVTILLSHLLLFIYKGEIFKIK